jgi:hypothetical protein
MLTILLLGASLCPIVICHGERVCLAANEFAGRYAVWTRSANAQVSAIDLREVRTWEQTEKAFKRLKHRRQER